MDRSYYLHLRVKKVRFGLGINLSKAMGPLSLFFSAQESLGKTGM